MRLTPKAYCWRPSHAGLPHEASMRGASLASSETRHEALKPSLRTSRVTGRCRPTKLGCGQSALSATSCCLALGTKCSFCSPAISIENENGWLPVSGPRPSPSCTWIPAAFLPVPADSKGSTLPFQVSPGVLRIPRTSRSDSTTSGTPQSRVTAAFGSAAAGTSKRPAK
jgi:hypothetical protein